MREDTIEICHLKKAYGEHVIFSNLTMELKKGAVTCLMAPSGAGKTTLLRILAGLEQADGGKIRGLEALRKSMVFQEPRLAEELTAAANIQLAVQILVHHLFPILINLITPRIFCSALIVNRCQFFVKCIIRVFTVYQNVKWN